MAEKIDFFQIYWKDEQKNKMLPWSIPYKNDTLTPYFENSIIRELVSSSDSDKIAVCSYKLADKMLVNIPPYEKLTEERLYTEFDVLAFTRSSKGHGLLHNAEIWHKGFKAIMHKIFNILGKSIISEPKYPIYQNAFIARTDIYRSYVNDMLIPVMDLMENNEEIKKLAWQDSKYYALTRNLEFSQRVKQFLGTDYCPLHPFICERLFSLWIDGKGLNVQYL